VVLALCCVEKKKTCPNADANDAGEPGTLVWVLGGRKSASELG